MHPSRNNKIWCLKVQVLILCMKTMGIMIARVRSGVPQEPTSEHTEEAGDRDNSRFRRAGRKRPKFRAILAEPTAYRRRLTWIWPLDSESSITMELWRPPTSLLQSTSSSGCNGTLFLWCHPFMSCSVASLSIKSIHTARGNLATKDGATKFTL